MPMPFSAIRRWASNWGGSTTTEKRQAGASASPQLQGPSNTNPRESLWVIEDGGVRRASPDRDAWINDPFPQSEQTQRRDRKGKAPATENDDDESEENEPSPPPNSPTDVLGLLIHNMEFYRLGPDALSTFFRPKTRGQHAVLKYMRGEIEALREILQERDRAAWLALVAPQVTGTRATHRWLRDPGPQSVAELLAERDAAANNLREEAKNFSWPWNKPAAAGSPRTSGEYTGPGDTDAKGKSAIRFGKCQGHMSTCGAMEGCNIGRPPPPSSQNVRARLLQLARERGEDFNRTPSSAQPRRYSGGNGESSASAEPRWPFSEPLTDEESEHEDDSSSVDSAMVDAALEDQEFMDELYGLEQEDSSSLVAETARFGKARVVDTTDHEADSTHSGKDSMYGHEQQSDDDDSDGDSDDDKNEDDHLPLSRHGSRPLNSAAYEPWTLLDVPPVSPSLDPSPSPGRPMTGTASDEDSRDIYFDDVDNGRRLVPRLYYLAAFYPFHSTDGMTRVRELYDLCGCPPHFKPADVLLALLHYKPETRAFMARKVPGVARRANQINWMGVDDGMSAEKDLKLYWDWEQSRQPLFEMEAEEEEKPISEVPDSEEVARPRERTSKKPRHLTWKPVKSKLSEEVEA